jgi:hypothetical protein
MNSRISGIVRAEAEQMVIENLNVSLADLRPTDSTSSPIELQLYSLDNNNQQPADPSSLPYTKPVLNIVNCTFYGIQTAHAATIPIAQNLTAKGGLFSFYHDILEYDVNILNNDFNHLAATYHFDWANKPANVTVEPSVVTIFKTVGVNEEIGQANGMKISIKGSKFDEVFQDVGADNGFVRMELFNFREPIYQFVLEDTVF